MYNRLIFLLFILLNISIQAAATTWQEGIELMENKKYNEAKKYFESKEEIAKDLEYYSHLAWISYQLQEFDKAKLYLITAQRIYGPNKWLQEALEKVNHKLGLSHIEHKQIWGVTKKDGSLFGMNSLFFTILILSIALASAHFVLKEKRSIYLIVRLSLLIILILMSFQFVWQKYQFEKLPDGILAENQTWDIKKEEEIFWPKGLSVRVVQEKNTNLVLKNTLGEEIEVPRNALETQ